MKKLRFYRSALFIVLMLFVSAVFFSCKEQKDFQTDELVGAWKGKVQFTTGAFAEIKDFEFMYVFNVGGTMTESSNYDGVPPTPPAYGIWKKTSEINNMKPVMNFTGIKFLILLKNLPKSVGFQMPATEFFQKKSLFQRTGVLIVQQLN